MIATKLTMQLTHGELLEGMLVWNSGVLFEVADLDRHAAIDGSPQITIRYTGIWRGGDQSVRNTGFNGGRYGAYAWVPVTVAVEGPEMQTVAQRRKASLSVFDTIERPGPRRDAEKALAKFGA